MTSDDHKDKSSLPPRPHDADERENDDDPFQNDEDRNQWYADEREEGEEEFEEDYADSDDENDGAEIDEDYVDEQADDDEIEDHGDLYRDENEYVEAMRSAGDRLHAEDIGDAEYDDALNLDEEDVDQDRDEPDELSAPQRIEPAPPEVVEEQGRKAKAMGFVMRLISLGFAIAAFFAIAGAAYSALYMNRLNADLPDYEALAEYAPPVTTRVYAGDGSLVAEFARERRLFVPIESIPDHVKAAFVSAEDKSFYNHKGLDFRGVIRAQIANIGNILNQRRLEGGSTITQQVAKNFLLSSEQRIERKVREMLIARKMERTFTKDHILELYLNEIYLGNRSYGVAAAALNYFDKSLADLTIAEASYLAAITKGPSNYHPIVNERRAIARRNWVIGRLLSDGHISREDAAEARAQPLGAQIAPPLGARDWTMEYFAEEVRKQIVDLYGVEALYDGGLAVRTTVDPTLQKVAGDVLRRWLIAYDQRHGWRGPLDRMDTAEDWATILPEKVSAMRDERVISEDLDLWRPALVLSTDDPAAARIGFEDGAEAEIPFALLAWAREYVSANDLGPKINQPSEVLQVGDIIYVEAANLEMLRAAEVALAADQDEENIESPADEASSDDTSTENDELNFADRFADQEIYALRQIPAVNGGLIAIDPHTGRVLAMVGGFSFQLSEFNRAVQAERQPGSTFKPFVYSVALDSGYTPASKVLDAPFVAPGVDSWYKPGNYIEGRYYGESTLRLGIEQSRNAMTARLAQDLGIGRIVEYIERFKLSERLPRELAISLGAGETTLMRITAAYSIFVNGGKRVEPVLIDRIQDRKGDTIYRRDERSCFGCRVEGWAGQTEPQIADAREQVMDPRTAYQITSILEGVVVRGTGSAVRRVADKPLAGKTGTTNDHKDAWFVGFSPDLAAGVYVGFDMPQTLGHGEAGGKVAAPIFADFMTAALQAEPGIPFRVPSGVRLVRVNAKTGRPASPSDRNVILEAFKADDVIGGSPASEITLDPLSSRPEEDDDDDDLNGLY